MVLVILLDTCFFVALINKDDQNHNRADQLLEDILKGMYGTRITSDYVLDEAITVTWVRTKNKGLVKDVGELIMGPQAIVALQTNPPNYLADSWSIFQKYASIDRKLSFTDCSLINFARQNNIQQILSFDSEFDGLIARIC